MSILVEKIHGLVALARQHRKTFFYLVLGAFIVICLALAGGKTYQSLDKDANRGAIEFDGKAHGDESYSTPVYLDQGWSRSDSLWFYNTTQGSNLLPYDFYLALEMPDSDTLMTEPHITNKFRYLPQKKTFFNPDALPLGFVKDTYEGRSYVGYTCAACHTGQVNYQGKAIRIDGGPAMADMVGYLTTMEKALKATLDHDDKFDRFSQAVLQRKNDYKKKEQVLKDLQYWYEIRRQYNIVNHSGVKYGYARLDAFGRIFNRVLQYVINKPQLKRHLLAARKPGGERLLTLEQVERVLDGVNETIVDRDSFMGVIQKLSSTESGYPGLSIKDILRLRDKIFNEPDAPVSYPFLWGTTHSDYVQWNGIAGNSGPGPIGRNVGEVMGVFATLDWTASRPWYAKFDIPAIVSGQKNKRNIINFKSSADVTNLRRLENHLKSLKSPVWPEAILGSIDRKLADKGQRLYAEYCQSCHEVIDRNDWERIIIAQMLDIEKVNTDPTMAENSVNHTGSAGNFKHTYQGTSVGDIIVPEEAPVAALLSAAARGVVATPDQDKLFFRRWLDWLYLMAASFFQNDIKESVRSGDYRPATTSRPFDPLLSYKARPLNGIWATAPYLHNGSVPTLYDLLLPKKQEGDADDGEYRPDDFWVGSREFDPVKVGFESECCQGTKFVAGGRANFNTGHEYAAGRTSVKAGEKPLPALNKEQRMALVEYLKTL